ncbi:MAG: hypothetical protein ACI9SK_000789 [Zhongshania sp.]|jgi:hypothetical protein
MLFPFLGHQNMSIINAPIAWYISVSAPNTLKNGLSFICKQIDQCRAGQDFEQIWLRVWGEWR